MASADHWLQAARAAWAAWTPPSDFDALSRKEKAAAIAEFNTACATALKAIYAAPRPATRAEDAECADLRYVLFHSADPFPVQAYMAADTAAARAAVINSLRRQEAGTAE